MVSGTEVCCHAVEGLTWRTKAMVMSLPSPTRITMLMPPGPCWNGRLGAACEQLLSTNFLMARRSKKAWRSSHALLLLHCHAAFYERGQLLPQAPPLRALPLLHPDPHLLLPNLVTKVFESATFEASKLDVMFVGVCKDEHPDDLPRIYTLTHCDLTAMLTLTISTSVNTVQLQGWYKKLQRDDVVAMWRRCQGAMSLHVHCHISDGHWFRDAFARLRFHIFKRELPVVLKAFRHGDGALLKKYPELEKAPVWVYFHSSAKEFDKVECWGPLVQVGQFKGQDMRHDIDEEEPVQCKLPCDCCSPR